MSPVLLLIFLAVISSGQACQSNTEAPRPAVEDNQAPREGDKDKNPKNSSTLPTSEFTLPRTTPANRGNDKRKERAAETAEYTIVSNIDYDPSHLSKCQELLKAVDDIGHIICKPEDLALEKLKNEGGKFAITCNVRGAPCDTLEAYAWAMKGLVEDIKLVRIKCGDKPELVIDN
ncbi:hypothetical protein Y032_0013g2159 [Ancylostoma ceylanicum]|uniref:SCP domain-containing protein n=1 Tax=Ancylostoma ceylanicum TaxID=53326 RepID=A0A016VDR1_9BILA|nr:hypothetical protein Y032_0013g2159 [Ancylostoma ceylanicum]